MSAVTHQDIPAGMGKPFISAVLQVLFDEVTAWNAITPGVCRLLEMGAAFSIGFLLMERAVLVGWVPFRTVLRPRPVGHFSLEPLCVISGQHPAEYLRF